MTALRHRFPRRRAAVVGATAAAALLLTAAPALAHVSVQPGEAEKGGYSTIAFKVPNERDNASTVKLEVTMPADHPLASVMPKPVPGWDVDVTRSKLDKPLEMHGEKIDEAVTKVTWTGGKVEPGTFQEFPLSVGQLPEDADRLVFKALQTYDNKEVVRWIEEPAKDGSEPENPAPVLRLSEPAEGAGGHSHGGAEDAGKADAQNSDAGHSELAAESGTGDTTARVLGGLGLAAGVAGLVVALLSRRRSA
ncbi:YcnI family protein [Streptomyces meridianus]|uniref:YcnI family protein n=1 Tax=Streptomyces meridianus TaxID=2938945 RepID=A0ABT0X7Q0_9ACTN|nr:YcnI family protein [Streptomyces meridianus]MCM2578563.1 YcnI family protein [Streptomyces meridianus]